MTELYFLAAFVNKQREPPLMEALDEEEQKAWNMKDKWSLWQSWKWAIVCYELAFTSEIIIAFASFFVSDEEAHKWNRHFDHVVPLLLLLFEALINTTPVVKRHFMAVALCFLGYFVAA
eukprot:CAMPEP_0170499634 /NCGR_PEP_ID=MMETSP0208-20121228/32055_1 /TAXON_ID=197538 /ORGANISM="Strombidium inclinatum, Strain S3" /LENGTH=118 /DNA_ID=CAMNT_0010777269 /DNA_START=187 /DNA_END=539 /DNA_ORIENTATION=+